MFEHLKQKRVFENFKALNDVPRCSYQEERVSAFLFEKIKSLGLHCIQEACGNIIATKPATKGYEDKEAVILQAHMDMVCVKAEGSNHDFSTDPIEMYIEGDFLRAKDTTLGADNGIGVAMILSILEDNTLEHPEITAFITIAEETGMDGAILADYSLLNGKKLINLDSEEDTAITVACSGGVDFTMLVDLEHEDLSAHPVAKSLKAYKVSVLNLSGGHSGVDIKKKGASAIKLLNRYLLNFGKARIFDISAGSKRNAIPVSAGCCFVTDANPEEVKQFSQKMQEMFRFEYSERDPKITIEVVECQLPKQIYSAKSSDRILKIMSLIPHGVAAMAQNMQDLVETSSNFAIIENNGDHLALYTSIRSSLKSKLEDMVQRMTVIAQIFDLNYRVSDGYPAWEYKPQNELLEVARKSFEEIYKKEPEVMSIHAGLECAFFAQKMPEVDMISIGPNIYNPHTIEEYTEIPSVETNYEFLTAILRNL